MSKIRVLIAATALAALTGFGAQASDFGSFLREMRANAIAEGVRPATVDAAFRGLSPNARVIELDRRQPEFTLSFWRYFRTAVSDTRIANGQAALARYGAGLERASAASGVPAHVLTAFWGLETAYGEVLGDFDLVGALATLAYDPRRARFFRAQLLAALKIIDRGDLPLGSKSSWAGAFGQMQFMPETFLRAAIDGDGDGRRDLMGNLNDAFQSAGNLLRASGWRAGERWGREVRLPQGFDFRLVEERTQGLAAWAGAGVTLPDGRPLPIADIDARLLLPAGAAGPAFLAYPNFDVIMRWNRSTLYALAIGHLSDRINGAPPLSVAPSEDDRRLRLSDIATMQRLLAQRGFDPGPVDGKAGPATRAALRRFQASVGLPTDGHPTPALLDRLQGG